MLDFFMSLRPAACTRDPGIFQHHWTGFRGQAAERRRRERKVEHRVKLIK